MKQKTTFAAGLASGVIVCAFAGSGHQPVPVSRDTPIVGTIPADGAILVIDNEGHGFVVNPKGDAFPVVGPHPSRKKTTMFNFRDAARSETIQLDIPTEPKSK